MIIFSKAGKGHEIVTEDIVNTAMKMLQQGYQFWENLGNENKIELGNQVKITDIVETKSYFAMSPRAGG